MGIVPVINKPLILTGPEASKRYIELLTANKFEGEMLHWRLLPDPKGVSGSANKTGTLAALSSVFNSAQQSNFSPFLVINAGGTKKEEISRIRALWIDIDGGQPPESISWHCPPHFIVSRDDSHWHAYWIVDSEEIRPADAEGLLKRLAAHYGGDPNACKLTQVLRVPGYKHLKNPDQPFDVIMTDLTGGRTPEPYGLLEIIAGLPDLPEPSEPQTNGSRQPVNRDTLLEMLRHIDPTFEGDRDGWIAVAGAIKSAIVIDPDTGPPDPDFDGAALFDQWSSGDLNPAFKPVPTYIGAAACLKDYESLSADKPNGSGVGTLAHLARAGGWQGSPILSVLERFEALNGSGDFDPEPAGEARVDESAWGASEEPEPVANRVSYPKLLTGPALAAATFPPVEHLWGEFILEGHPNALDGDGGIGKTQLLIQIAVAVAAGAPLFGQPVKQQPAMLVLCEDDPAKVQERVNNACAELEVDLANIPLFTWPLVGCESVLAAVDETGAVRAGPFFSPLCDALSSFDGPFMLGLDTQSDVAEMNENSKPAVNAFAKRVLGKLARDYGATPVITRHPSKASMSDGTYYAGAVAGNAAYRVRLALMAKERGNVRFEVMKANYAAKGAGLDLYYAPEAGVFRSWTHELTANKAATENDAILKVVADYRSKGQPVQLGHGKGVQPSEIAEVLSEECDIHLTKSEVAKRLRRLLSMQRLTWTEGTGGKNASPATLDIAPEAELEIVEPD